MKYQEGHFLQIPRSFFDICKEKKLSVGAIAMYLFLKEYEHAFSGRKNDDYIFHRDSDIAKDMGVCERSVSRYRTELVSAGIIDYKRLHFKIPDSNKLSDERVSYYKCKY